MGTMKRKITKITKTDDANIEAINIQMATKANDITPKEVATPKKPRGRPKKKVEELNDDKRFIVIDSDELTNQETISTPEKTGAKTKKNEGASTDNSQTIDATENEPMNINPTRRKKSKVTPKPKARVKSSRFAAQKSSNAINDETEETSEKEDPLTLKKDQDLKFKPESLLDPNESKIEKNNGQKNQNVKEKVDNSIDGKGQTDLGIKESNSSEAGSASPQMENRVQGDNISGEDDSDELSSSCEDEVDICERNDLPQSLKDRAQKLAVLRQQMKRSVADNKKDIYKEFEKSKNSNKSNDKYDRKRKEAEELLEKQNIEELGLDYERVRSWNYSIEGVEKYNGKQDEKKSNTVVGFADWNDVAQRKYNKLVKELKPDVESYRYQKSISSHAKAIHGDSIRTYEDLTMVLPTDLSKPSENALEKLSTSIIDQQTRHAKAIKPPKDVDQDVTFINDRNAHFNRKISRAYDKYTKDIRESFERGTAL